MIYSFPGHNAAGGIRVTLVADLNPESTFSRKCVRKA
jgi:hypothetical protein